MGKKLSEKGKQFLCENWLKLSNEKLAETLGVSVSNISVKARELGLPDKRDYSPGSYKRTTISRLVEGYEPSGETLIEMEGRKLTKELLEQRKKVRCNDVLKIEIKEEHGLIPVRIVSGEVIHKNENFIVMKLDHYVECFRYVDFYTGKAAVI